MPKKNLAELDRILDRIRNSYDVVADYLPKAVYLKRAFEDRYLECLKNKIDLKFFLKGEQEFMQRFLDEAQVVKERRESYQERNEGGFANNVIKQLQSGIASYPILSSLHGNCIKEVSRLYGALHEFLEHYWDGISYYISNVNADIEMQILHLERSLSDVYTVGAVRPPKVVEFYNKMVSRNMSSSSERIRAAQDTIQFAGIWINSLSHILDVSMKQDRTGNPPQVIRAARLKISNIIKDFRLEAFAKQKKH